MPLWLPYLFYLACPISMGVMMWVMMRGDHSRMGVHSNEDATSVDAHQRIAELENQVAELLAAARRDPEPAAHQPSPATP